MAGWWRALRLSVLPVSAIVCLIAIPPSPPRLLAPTPLRPFVSSSPRSSFAPASPPLPRVGVATGFASLSEEVFTSEEIFTNVLACLSARSGSQLLATSRHLRTLAQAPHWPRLLAAWGEAWAKDLFAGAADLQRALSRERDAARLVSHLTDRPDVTVAWVRRTAALADEYMIDEQELQEWAPLALLHASGAGTGEVRGPGAALWTLAAAALNGAEDEPPCCRWALLGQLDAAMTKWNDPDLWESGLKVYTNLLSQGTEFGKEATLPHRKKVAGFRMRGLDICGRAMQSHGHSETVCMSALEAAWRLLSPAERLAGLRVWPTRSAEFRRHLAALLAAAGAAVQRHKTRALLRHESVAYLAECMLTRVGVDVLMEGADAGGLQALEVIAHRSIDDLKSTRASKFQQGRAWDFVEAVARKGPLGLVQSMLDHGAVRETCKTMLRLRGYPRSHRFIHRGAAFLLGLHARLWAPVKQELLACRLCGPLRKFLAAQGAKPEGWHFHHLDPGGEQIVTQLTALLLDQPDTAR